MRSQASTPRKLTRVPQPTMFSGMRAQHRESRTFSPLWFGFFYPARWTGLLNIGPLGQMRRPPKWVFLSGAGGAGR
jgi:hypothetical protein